eukprot:TRINITY_DN27813_c0_g1_i1.p1 TRINITY_DN27813_c0_g1~~TRINITY_DN27813_c0_g1_i1.p1  ORF type:complete len:320 (-),score=3.07 TRINITY_DN27813_c0_g1_i1:38-997(-)
MPTNIWFGVTMASLGAFSSAFGQTLMRLSKFRAEMKARQARERTCTEDIRIASPWRRPVWILGELLYVLSGILGAVAFVYAPMAVLVVIYAMRLPVIAVLASTMLNVKISESVAVGSVLCTAGCIVSLINSPHRACTTLNSPKDFFTFAITAYLIISVIAMCGCLFLLRRPRPPRIILPLLVGWINGIEKLFNSGMGRLAHGAHWYDLRWCWLFIFMMLFTVLGGIVNLVGVEMQDTHTFLPAAFGFQVLISGIQSQIFGEFAQMRIHEMACWIFGLVVAVIGTFLVVREEQDSVTNAGLDQELTASTNAQEQAGLVTL